MNKIILIANWKMNPRTLKEASSLLSAAERASRSGVALVVCPPFPYLKPLSKLSKRVLLGAQDCSWEQEGPLTGEVSPRQLRNVGCSFVIIGHSERKKLLGETPAMAVKKAAAARKAGLRIVLCAEDAKELRTYKKRLRSFKNILAVFEPSSAISTQGGRRVTPAEIAKTARSFKKIAGRGVPVLYGGSVDAESIGDILARGNVQGALVGAASLDSREFSRLVSKAVLR